MKKTAPTKFEIQSSLQERWSPRAFANKPVETEKIQSVFEAARWAASAFNEQPWRFLVGTNNDETYKNILLTLIEWNQQWAQQAPVLVLNVAKRTFSHNGVNSVTFKYDLGQSVANMAIEIVHQGLISHQMSGFDPEKARELFNIPDDFQAISVIAIGYYGDIAKLPADFAEIESKPRTRKKFNELVFSDTFGNASPLFK